MMKAQGATEYLVLLAVVLIVALVSVALLGFFPGMASDAQMTQSSVYWQSATPIAIVETNAKYMYSATDPNPHYTVPYLLLRNTGSYPIIITKIFAGNQNKSYVWTWGWAPSLAMDLEYAMQPGEEKIVGKGIYWPPNQGLNNGRFILFNQGTGSYPANFYQGAAQSYCVSNSPSSYLVVNDFGFEYQTRIDGQIIIKRQMGAKPLVIKCT